MPGLKNQIKDFVYPVYFKYLHSKVSVKNILDKFPLYKPNGFGNYLLSSRLTIQTINQVFPFLSSLSKSVNKDAIQIESVLNFPKSADDFQAVSDLQTLFDKHGSDKSNCHNYENIYGPILKNKNEITAVLEVGLGTNNTDVVSNMGAAGRPGASLRAFREFLPNAKIFGADIDKRILFSEDRIETFYIDQTNPDSFLNLPDSLPDLFDLIIDDGLHSPDANVQTLKFGLSKIKIGGWVVIEDIIVEAIPVWDVVSAMLPNQYRSFLFEVKGGYVFAVNKLS